MARLTRFILPGQPQHVIVRGNNREPIFVDDDDYRFYLDKLANGAAKHGCEVHAYVLMTNHVHLLVTPTDESGLGKLVQYLGRYYVQYFNHVHQRSGTLWEGRYKATLIDSEAYLLTCHRYIELNPVRAGMVERPREYHWSSYPANAHGVPDHRLTPHPLYLALGNDGEDRSRAYRALFRNHLPDQDIELIRKSTNKSWVLGNDRFREKIEGLLNRHVAPKSRGGDRRSKSFRDSINRD